MTTQTAKRITPPVRGPKDRATHVVVNMSKAPYMLTLNIPDGPRRGKPVVLGPVGASPANEYRVTPAELGFLNKPMEEIGDNKKPTGRYLNDCSSFIEACKAHSGAPAVLQVRAA